MRALVTGGGGFLGSAIVSLLLARGERVRILSRSDYPDLAARGVEVHRGDIAEPAACISAAEGCDIVYHVAALPGIWGRWVDFYRTNVTGTENILNACRQWSIRRLVYSSSPSVVFHPEGSMGADEHLLYPQTWLGDYPKTKAMAERTVIAMNRRFGLSTVSLRPHLIWGPGDNHLIPRILNRAFSGRLVRVGDGLNRVDTIFIDNAARAHIQAGDALREKDSPVAGKCYFISQDEPIRLWDWINRFVEAAGLPKVSHSLPASVAYAIGAAMEGVYSLFGIHSEPRLTRFLAAELSRDHYYDITAAKRDFGYHPEITTERGFSKTFASDYFKDLVLELRGQRGIT